MSFDVIPLPEFIKQLKNLAKKYPSLKTDLASLEQALQETPRQGTSLGNDCYKIRIAIKSKARGKSGGARIITCVKIVQHTVYLLTIYDKSDRNTISNLELKELIKQLQ